MTMDLRAMYSARAFAQETIEREEAEFSLEELAENDTTAKLWAIPAYRLARSVLTLTQDAGVCL